MLILIFQLPTKSLALVPRNSPRMVTLVPGGPSFGDNPVTTGGGAIFVKMWLFGGFYYGNFNKL